MPRSLGIGRVGDPGSSTPGGGGASAVPDLAALSAVNDALLVNGAILGVGTMQDVYELDKASATAADGIDVVLTLSGTGRWKRKFVGGGSWAYQAAWFVDSATGYDENDGAAAITTGYNGPLATIGELMKRLGQDDLQVDMTVDIADTGTIIADQLFSATSTDAHTITVRGVPTGLYSGFATAVTNYNGTTGVADLLTDAAIAVSWTASGLVGKLGQITNGANIATFVVGKDLGAKQARVSRYFDITNFAQLQPIVNDLFVIYDVTKLEGFIAVECFGQASFIFQNLELGTGASGGIGVLAGFCQFAGCQLHNLAVDSGAACNVVASRLDGINHTLSPNSLSVDSCLFTRTGGHSLIVDQGGFVSVFNASMVQASAGVDVSAGGGVYLLDTLAVYDSTGAGVTVDAHGTVECVSNILLFGSGNTTYGLRLRDGGMLSYSTLKPTITGTSGNASIGGLDVDWTMVPYTNPDALAAVRDLASEELGARYPFDLSLMLNAGLMPH